MLPCYHGQLSERKLEGLSNTFLVRQSVVEEKFIVSKVDDRKRMYNFGHPHLCHEGSETIEDHSTTTFPKLAVLRMELFEALVTMTRLFPPQCPGPGLGAVNGSFSDDTGYSGHSGHSGALVSMTPPPQQRAWPGAGAGAGAGSSLPPDSVYSSGPQLQHHSSPFFSAYSSLPRPSARPQHWAAAPLRLPDWSEAGYSGHPGAGAGAGWALCQPPQQPRYPPDYGLPRQRPEVHLATNPLDTLEEESPGTDIFQDQFQEAASHSHLRGLGHAPGAGPGGGAPVSDNSESSGRGSSSSGRGAGAGWGGASACSPSSSQLGPTISTIHGGALIKKPCQTSSARESPDEGIQTDSGTDV